MLLTIGMVALVLLHLLGLGMGIAESGWTDVDRLYLWRTAIVIVGGLGAWRGSDPVRYILAFVLLLIMFSGAYFLISGAYETVKAVIATGEILVAGFVIYLLIFDNATANFLRLQRVRNFGQKMRGGGVYSGSREENNQKERGSKGNDWEQHDDLYE